MRITREQLVELDLDPRLINEIEQAAEPELTTGCPVTVVPRAGPGESVDTEPGLQPWTAEYVAETSDGRVIVFAEYENSWQTPLNDGRKGNLRILPRDSIRPALTK